jgi:hypothetical protein
MKAETAKHAYDRTRPFQELGARTGTKYDHKVSKGPMSVGAPDIAAGGSILISERGSARLGDG